MSACCSYKRLNIGSICATVALGLILAIALQLVQPACALASNVSAAEQTAFDRSVAAIKDYQHQPHTIQVDVSDLGLSSKQKQQVQDRVHYTGEYFWVKTLSSGRYDANTLYYECIADDATIASMRTKYEAGMRQALSAGKGKSGYAKLHALHDWLIDQNEYRYDGVYNHKSSYGVIAEGTGDCLSFALGAQALYNRAGFKMLYVENMAIDHAWNYVNIGGKWFNVDTGFDNGYSYGGSHFWPKGVSHIYLALSDKVLGKNGAHGSKWTVFENGKPTTAYHATSNAYVNTTKVDSSCKKKLGKNRSFTRDRVTYKVIAKGKVRVSACLRQGSTVSIPSSIKYRGYTYKVTSVSKKAFRGASNAGRVNLGANVASLSKAALGGSNAKVLKVSSKKLSKKKVRGCLSGSKVVQVKVPKSKVKAYKKIFTKKNCGKSVRVTS